MGWRGLTMGSEVIVEWGGYPYMGAQGMGYPLFTSVVHYTSSSFTSGEGWTMNSHGTEISSLPL
jgi:hypothetical protein